MNRKLGWIVAVVVIVGLGIGLWLARDPQDPADRPLTIGAILPLTGGAAFIGQPSREGIEMAVADINALGGIKGRQVNIIFEDSANEARASISSLQKLASIDNATAVITALSAPSFPIAEHLRTSDATCVQIATFVTPTAFPEVSSWSFRLYNNADQEASLLARLIVETLEIRRAAIYYNNDDYGRDVARAFSAVIETSGGQIVASETFARGEQNHRSALAKIRAAAPQALLFVGNDQSFATAIRQAREAEIDAVFVATTGFSVAAYQNIAGPGAEGTYFAAPSFESEMIPQTESQVAFRREYEERYGKPASVLSAFPYACVELISVAATRAPSFSATDLRDTLLSLENVETVVGTVSVSANGDFITDLVIKQIRDGMVKEIQ